jgi:hypothetical protein
VIVDQHIDFAEFFYSALHHGIHLFRIPHVHGQRQGAFAEPAHLIGRGFEVFHTAAAQHHIGPGAGAFDADAFADANAAAGDDNGFTFE